ncbi:lipoprotein insertase outer membrane protein LolB [Thalassotalea mangrovi]|uniref:Outer-membrane lipoprotein LolB n=1 Tax=Thalassotalea mangrovi TaxID=2572245 RepID=A0A4U1B614_9GAMM|nr:lipoprotein insertase outer membrane protein LolB [Thalassotalea mangrovi]TKB45942.1 outer membrane lipoprotein LolB [Thalassotalea mangrovi]
MSLTVLGRLHTQPDSRLSQWRLLIKAALLSTTLSACALFSPAPEPQSVAAQQLRQQQMQEIDAWRVKGKVAFIRDGERSSANIFWQHAPQDVTLNLTTFMGVNVLNLASTSNGYQLQVDGKTYTGTELQPLLSGVAGVELPVDDLTYWIKGSKAKSQDALFFNAETGLPARIQALRGNRMWQIDYQDFSRVEAHYMPAKLTLKHGQLTIKLAISDWQLQH